VNKINEFKYLKDWCDEYYKTVGLKVHPSNVPVDVVLDDIMGHITMIVAHEKQFISWIDFARGQIKDLQEKLLSLENEIAHVKKDLLEARVENKPKKGNKSE
jgi:hypothetical protein